MHNLVLCQNQCYKDGVLCQQETTAHLWSFQSLHHCPRCCISFTHQVSYIPVFLLLSGTFHPYLHWCLNLLCFSYFLQVVSDPYSPAWHGYFLSICFLLMNLIHSASFNVYVKQYFNTGLRVRTAMTTSIYRKVQFTMLLCTSNVVCDTSSLLLCNLLNVLGFADDIGGKIQGLSGRNHQSHQCGYREDQTDVF